MWVGIQLQSLKFQILRLFRAKSSLTFGQLQSVDSKTRMLHDKKGNKKGTWSSDKLQITSLLTCFLFPFLDKVVSNVSLGITNSTGYERIWAASLLHVMQLPNPFSHSWLIYGHLYPYLDCACEFRQCLHITLSFLYPILTSLPFYNDNHT